MKNVRAKQKTKGPSALSEVIGLVLVAAVCIAGTFFLTSSYYKTQLANVATPETEMGTVAVVNTEMPEGSYADGNYSMTSVPLAQIPENAIVSAADTEGKVAKIPLKANTVLTSDMLVSVDMDEDVSMTTRQVGINYVTMNSKVEIGDYIDIRLKTYSTDSIDGYSDQVVLAKKKILAMSGSTIYLNLDQEEVLRLGVAAVQATLKATETTKNDKTVLYAVALASPIQPKAIEDYENAELAKLVERDPNLAQQAQAELEKQALLDAGQAESNINTVPSGGVNDTDISADGSVDFAG